MNNIYLIYGMEDYLIKKELNKIIKNTNVKDDNIIKYNLDEVNVTAALDDDIVGDRGRDQHHR